MEEIFNNFKNIVKNFSNGETLLFGVHNYLPPGQYQTCETFLLHNMYLDIIRVLLSKNKRIVCYVAKDDYKEIKRTENLKIIDCNYDEFDSKTYSFNEFCEEIKKHNNYDAIILEQLNLLELGGLDSSNEFSHKLKISLISQLCQFAKDNKISLITSGVLWRTPPYKKALPCNKETFDKHYKQFNNIDHLVKINTYFNEPTMDIEFYDTEYKRITYLYNSSRSSKIPQVFYKTNNEILRLYRNGKLFGLSDEEAIKYALDWSNSLFV